MQAHCTRLEFWGHGIQRTPIEITVFAAVQTEGEEFSRKVAKTQRKKRDRGRASKTVRPPAERRDE